MTKSIFIHISLMGCLMLASCGRNDAPTGKAPNSSDAERTYCGEASKLASKAGSWSIAPHWDIGPKMGTDDIVESVFCMKVFDSKGQLAESIENIQVVAWMPSMGHDTGNEKPIVDSVKDGVVKVRNIFFYMTGGWEVIVRAKVNQLEDEARFAVEITE